MPTRRTTTPRPLAVSLARCGSALALAAALVSAGKAAPVSWDGGGGDLLWNNPLNWDTNVVPLAADDLTFGLLPGTVQLNGDRIANSITFTDAFTLGAYGTRSTLSNTAGTVTVNPGVFATINANYFGTNTLAISGGGTLYMNNPMPTFSGNITVSGAGTVLLHRQEGPTVQYNGVGSAQEVGRFDQNSLGLSTAVKNITLSSGGTYKIINAGNNSEGNFKNIIIGTGGGTLDLGAGYIVQNLDDTGQITATTEAFTKAGKGRLTITGTMATVNPLGGIVNVNGGLFDLSNSTSQTVGANTYQRFTGIAGLGTTLNINTGGVFMGNSGTDATVLDPAAINLNGGILSLNGANSHAVGFASATAAGPTVLTVSGSSTWLSRDLFAPQTTGRLPRLRAELDGTGTLEVRGVTAAGAPSRLVIERSTAGSDFSGTFKLVENSIIEANPRLNPSANGGTGTVVDTGKVLAGGDIEFAGWGSILDIRDSNPSAVSLVLDYTNNEITFTTTQPGNLNTITNNRATAATGTGHLLNYGTLTMGDHRFVIAGGNNYHTGFADTASITGNAVLIMNTDGSQGLFTNAAAITENAAGRSFTLLKAGGGTSGNRDLNISGAVSVSNVNISTGTMQLRGALGAIGLGFGGAAPTVTVDGGLTVANGLPTPGILHLDSQTGFVLAGGGATHIAAASNNDRLVDSAILNLRGNGTVRMTSLSGTGTTETIGTVNIFGHGTIDSNNIGTTPTPVAITVGALSLASTYADANFISNVGNVLGAAGADTARIVLPGTATGFLSARHHSANEWAKYDSTVDNGFELGVQAFVAADYTIGSAETTWATGQQIKQNGATLPTLTANRNAARFNFQTTATNQALNVAGFVLTTEEGGIISSANTIGFTDGATAAAPSGTAGITAGTTAPAQLHVYSNAQIDIRTPVRDNLGLDLAIGGGDDNMVDFVKSGTGTVRLIHQDLGVGTAATAINPFTAATWTSTLTGNWVINDGRLDVHRGQFLGGRPVILNGGHLEINQPVSNANADTIIPGWGNNIIVNGNASVVSDDNGESADGNTGDRAAILLGSLTINNGALFGHGAFSDQDHAYMGGATLAGTPTFNALRGGVNSATIINGVLAGTGFNSVALAGNNASIVLGGGVPDVSANTYNGAITLYAGTLRPNKANGTLAITDGAAAEDVVLNGGNLFWGPGQHGDLSTTNNVNIYNNGLASGIAPTSPAPIKLAGMNQVADTAVVTLLNGTVGESDRITNDTFGGLIMKGGTLNVGLGTMEIGSATFSGGALGFDRGGTLKLGTASYLPGAFDQSVFTGLPAPGAYTTLEYGAGGVSLTGQFIQLGNGFSGNVAGAGGRLRLGGDLTFTGSDLIGGSYGRKGIFVATSSTFREIGGSHVDLMGGTRDFNINTDSLFTITARMTNGGITKSGGGALILEPYEPNSFAGGVTVNAGIVQAKGDGALGTGQVTVGGGGTVKLDSGWTYGNNFVVGGAGSVIPGGGSAREVGALIAESGYNRINGAFTLIANATIAGGTFLDPSVTPATGGSSYRIGTLAIASPLGITSVASNLTLSGFGDGLILNGINTGSGSVFKEGSGIWTIAGASTYTGTTTIAAGILNITNAAALGSTATGTTVLGGGTLAFAGGLTVAEPLTLNGNGSAANGGGSGALDSWNGNTYNGTLAIASDAVVRSSSGTLILGNSTSVTGGDVNVTFAGAGHTTVQGNIVLGDASITKTGTGTLTLAGTNTYAGITNVNGGLLSLDYTTNNTGKIDSSANLNFGGGSLSILGSNTATTTQAAGATNLNSGGANISVTSGAGQSASLGLGTISRSPGATADFDLPASGNIVTASGNTNGILGGYATVGDTDWATVSGVNIAAFSGYTPLATSGAADNAIVTTDTLSAPVSVNSLKVTGGGLNAGANTITLASGGILYTGSGNSGIAGSGLVGSPTNELIVHVASGSFDIGAPIVGGTGQLTKTGPGTLYLSAGNTYTGAINVNGGALAVIGGGGGLPAGANRDIILNGGTFALVGADYDPAANTLQFVIGPDGGTLRSVLGARLNLNDGNTTFGSTATQLRGSGDLNLVGGGRYDFQAGTPVFTGFTGNVIVNDGFLMVGHSATFGGRPEQTVTLKSGSSVINFAGFGLGTNGMVNNIIAESGTDFYAQGGSRVYAGDIQLGGTHTIALLERDNSNQERQIYFNGRVTGTGVTLNVVGSNNGNPLYLAGGSNPFTGTINLNTNAVLEVRTPGSVGVNTGDVTVNLNGANSRLLLRHFQNGDYRTNVVVNDHAEVNSDRLAGFGGGGLQILSVNNLTLNGNDKIVTIGGGNTYHTRVGGTMTLNATTNTILNVTASDLVLENGITFGTPGSTLDKRGAFSIIQRGSSNHTGTLLVQQSLHVLQDNGALPTTSLIDLHGGELRIDNSAVALSNRVNDAATITLAGGTLRVTGAETFGPFTAPMGNSTVVFNQVSDSVAGTLTIPSLTRAVGATVNFQSDFGGAVGSATLAQTRVSSRVILTGQPDVVGNEVMRGYFGNANLDFVQYDNTNVDPFTGLTFGVRELRNPTPVNAPTYQADTAETAWDDADIVRVTTAKTLTAARAVEALKVEAAITIDLAANNLRIDSGGLLTVGNAVSVNGTTGVLTAGPAVATPGTAELFLGGNNTLTLGAIVGNNTLSGQNVAVVKTGTGTVNLNGTNTFTGGLYVNSGTLNTTNPNFVSTTPSTIHLNGGVLLFNIANAATIGDLGVPDHVVNVNANSEIRLDNGALAGTDNDITVGALNITGPYTLRLNSFDSMDMTFTGTHTFTGLPTLDMVQLASGGNATGFFTLNGNITGSGFFVGNSGANDNTTSVLQIGGGGADTTANTYAGKVTILLGIGSTGGNTDDLRIELNKAAGTTAITGDLEINGGMVRNQAANQIADTSNLTINWGQYNANAQNETVNSVTVNGGSLLTAATTGTPAASAFNVTGAVTVMAYDDVGGGGVNGFTVGNNSTTTIGGLLTIAPYGRVHLAEGATAAVLNINGGLQMEGSLLTQNSGAGPNITRLNSNVTTLASSNPARIGNSTDSDTFTELNGTRTFTVADGTAGLDLVVSSVIRNSTAPVATGDLVKNGPGTMQLEGGATANSYSGTTLVNEGTLVLNKNAGVNSIANGALTIGDGTGGARADQVILRADNQIGDGNNVTIASSGLLDLGTFNTDDTIASLSGAGAVDLGPGSVLTVNGATSTTFSGVIQGIGALVKDGASTLELSGANEVVAGTTVQGAGKLLVTGSLGGAVTVSGTATLGGTGTINGAVTVNSILAPGTSPGDLTVNGTTTFNTGSSFSLEINGTTVGTGYDQLTIGTNGGVNITGGNITLALNFVPAFGDTFTVIDNLSSGAITGTFANLLEGGIITTNYLGVDYDFVGTYVGGTGNDLLLTVPEPTSAAVLLAGLGLTAGLRRFRRRA